LTVCGSLQRRSANRAVLDAASADAVLVAAPEYAGAVAER
jgi:NAD(P)H-dependent FMN reductase